jgi:uncharacterized membrane protein
MRWTLLSVVVIATVCADLLQSKEMKQVGEASDFRVLAGMARRKYLILAVFFMAVSFFAFLKLLQIAELSFAVPASAATLVIDTMLARILLKEHVNWQRWSGAALVAAGVYLVSLP